MFRCWSYISLKVHTPNIVIMTRMTIVECTSTVGHNLASLESLDKCVTYQLKLRDSVVCDFFNEIPFCRAVNTVVHVLMNLVC